MVEETKTTRAAATERTHLRPVEIAARTGLSKTLIMREIYRGELKAHRVRRAWIVPVEELERWLQRSNEAA
jgi:excisionase family DNA binding protein